MVYPVTDDFIIVAPRKTGSISVEEWAVEHNIDLIERHELESSIGNRDVYCLWRPTYDRIITGLNMAFNILAWEEINEDTPELHAAYMRYLEEFACTLDFTSPEPVLYHTQLLQKIENVQWIHLGQLRLFHLYLNQKYNKQYASFPHSNRGDGADLPNPQHTNLVKKLKLIDILNDYPDILLAVQARVSADILPNSIINLKKFVSY